MNFTLEALGRAETYRTSVELERIGKRVALMEFDTHGRGRVGMSDFRREVLSGLHPVLVQGYLQREALTGGDLHKLLALNTARLLGVEEQFGIKIDVSVPSRRVTIHGAGHDSFLEEAVRKAGGWRIDRNTLATKLIHAARLKELLEGWIRLRRKQTAGAAFEAGVRSAQVKQKVG